MSKRALIIVAEGIKSNWTWFKNIPFLDCLIKIIVKTGAEEIEVVVTVDTLRRGGVSRYDKNLDSKYIW